MGSFVYFVCLYDTNVSFAIEPSLDDDDRYIWGYERMWTRRF